MDFPLRSGERVSICWHNEGRWFEVTGSHEPIPLAKIPPYFGNGAIIYEPAAETEASTRDNMMVRRHGEEPAILRSRDQTRAGTLIYQAECPYIFSDAVVTGSYEARKPGAVILLLSVDRGKSWTELWRNPNRTGKIAVNMRKEITARYYYRLKVQLVPEQLAEVTGLKVRTTFVVSAG